MKPLTVPFVLLALLTCAADAADSPPWPLDSIDQRMQVCTPCHGKEGRATPDGYYPRIAGKPAGYLYNQLVNFREGRRRVPMMTYLTERQNDDFLHEMASYFATQSLPYPAPQAPRVSQATLDRGRMLVNEGDARRDIPACSACHGKRLLGVEPAVPGLLGLSHDYLISQLSAWRLGNRRARAPDCMEEIVRRMSREDLVAASAWLAAQPVPAPTLAEPDFEQPPPIRCGSIPGEARAP